MKIIRKFHNGTDITYYIIVDYLNTFVHIKIPSVQSEFNEGGSRTQICCRFHENLKPDNPTEKSAEIQYLLLKNYTNCDTEKTIVCIS